VKNYVALYFTKSLNLSGRRRKTLEFFFLIKIALNTPLLKCWNDIVIIVSHNLDYPAKIVILYGHLKRIRSRYNLYGMDFNNQPNRKD